MNLHTFRAAAMAATCLLVPFSSVCWGATPPAAPSKVVEEGSFPLAQTPTAVTEQLYATLLDVMKNAERLGFDGRYRKLEQPLRGTFNIPFMTKIVVGPTAWSQWNDEQKQNVTNAFAKFIISTYARRFDGYSGESFVVDGTKQLSNGTVVFTRLVRPHDDPINLNYVTRQNPDGSWQVVDVFLTGSISELATRRSEFSAVLQQQGYPGLLKALEEKANQDVSTQPR